MNSKLLEELRNDDRESQLFDISSDAIAISVLNGIQCRIDSEVNKLRISLLNKAKGKDSASIAINKACSKLRTQYMTAAISFVDPIRSIFKEHMSIPPHTLLPAEVKPKEPLTDEEMEKLDSKVKELYARYNRAMCMEESLKAELANVSFTASLEKSLLVSKSLHPRAKLSGQELQLGKNAIKNITNAQELMDDAEISQLRKHATLLDFLLDAEEESLARKVSDFKKMRNYPGQLDPSQMLDILEKIKLEKEQLESEERLACQEISNLVEIMDNRRKPANQKLAIPELPDNRRSLGGEENFDKVALMGSKEKLASGKNLDSRGKLGSKENMDDKEKLASGKNLDSRGKLGSKENMDDKEKFDFLKEDSKEKLASQGKL